MAEEFPSLYNTTDSNPDRSNIKGVINNNNNNFDRQMKEVTIHLLHQSPVKKVSVCNKRGCSSCVDPKRVGGVSGSVRNRKDVKEKKSRKYHVIIASGELIPQKNKLHEERTNTNLNHLECFINVFCDWRMFSSSIFTARWSRLVLKGATRMYHPDELQANTTFLKTDVSF